MEELTVVRHRWLKRRRHHRWIGSWVRVVSLPTVAVADRAISAMVGAGVTICMVVVAVRCIIQIRLLHVVHRRVLSEVWVRAPWGVAASVRCLVLHGLIHHWLTVAVAVVIPMVIVVRHHVLTTGLRVVVGGTRRRSAVAVGAVLGFHGFVRVTVFVWWTRIIFFIAAPIYAVWVFVAVIWRWWWEWRRFLEILRNLI